MDKTSSMYLYVKLNPDASYRPRAKTVMDKILFVCDSSMNTFHEKIGDCLEVHMDVGVHMNIRIY